MEKRLTITEAQEKAAKLGIHISRPTIILYCREKKLGYQLSGQRGGMWFVYATKFEEFILGKNNITEADRKALSKTKKSEKKKS